MGAGSDAGPHFCFRDRSSPRFGMGNVTGMTPAIVDHALGISPFGKSSRGSKRVDALSMAFLMGGAGC